MRITIISVLLIFIAVLISCSVSSCGKKEDKKMTEELINFIRVHEAKVKPLYRDVNLAYFNASTTGKKEEYKKWEDLQLQLTKIYTDKKDFEVLKRIRESKGITDEKLERQLEVLYLAYLGNQTDEKLLEEIVKMQVKVENKFSIFRAEFGGKKYSDNEIEDLLSTNKDSKTLQAAWEASKKVGEEVAGDVLKLVELRNKTAKELGFNNYHEMSLKLSEQDPEEIEKIFDELDKLTAGSFASLKDEIDTYLSGLYKIKKEELMPWHYQNRFFQQAPKIYEVDLDKYYKDKDVVKLTEDYYSGIGLPINDLIDKSDLFEKPGKYQHAYCSNIDREGDVRVVCNVKPNHSWMGTMLHEYGHAVYEKFMDNKNTPWLLRSPAHTFTTEAIAMLNERNASNPAWMKSMFGLPDEEVTKISEPSFNSLKLEQLIFSRWAQVMYRFEKGMYTNPKQDLNKLWWDLVEKYQLIKKPVDRNKPDYASKIHVASYPCYYHNYLLGAVFASQMNHYIAKNILKTEDINQQNWVNNKEVGRFFTENIFKPAALYKWNDMIKNATGEFLTAKYYAMQFVEK